MKIVADFFWVKSCLFRNRLREPSSSLFFSSTITIHLPQLLSSANTNGCRTKARHRLARTNNFANTCGEGRINDRNQHTDHELVKVCTHYTDTILVLLVHQPAAAAARARTNVIKSPSYIKWPKFAIQQRGRSSSSSSPT